MKILLLSLLFLSACEFPGDRIRAQKYAELENRLHFIEVQADSYRARINSLAAQVSEPKVARKELEVNVNMVAMKLPKGATEARVTHSTFATNCDQKCLDAIKNACRDGIGDLSK